MIDEEEPNDTCQDAQDIGVFTVPFILEGSLDTPPVEPDVDFYRFSTTPGTRLVADLEGQYTGKGTLDNPILGLFHSNCEQLTHNPHWLLPHWGFEVPDDGIFILAASTWSDWDFIGAGCCSGTYQLAISPPLPAIGSITGRVVDAVSEQPLPGNAPPFANTLLIRCHDDECLSTNPVEDQSTDSEGRFLFDRDFYGQLFEVGIYRVSASANEFQNAETEPFAVGEGENIDVGDIPLIPPPIVFSDIQPCVELLPQGGTCRYSVRINNNTSAPLRGLAWSPVDGFDLGSNLDFTNFEASSSRPGSSRSTYVVRQRIFLRASGSDDFGFQFGVPSFVRDGATFCTYLFIGLEPDPLVNTIRQGSLFCVTKGVTGFQVMSESESQKLLRSFSGRNKMMRSGIPARKR